MSHSVTRGGKRDGVGHVLLYGKKIWLFFMSSTHGKSCQKIFPNELCSLESDSTVAIAAVSKTTLAQLQSAFSLQLPIYVLYLLSSISKH